MDECEESDVPNTFTGEYYDEKYFAGEKTYRKADGTLGKWGYKNPEGEWTGAADVVYAWQVMFNPQKMLDLGCGRGTFIAYARDIGIEAVGFDFSPYAISHHYIRCKPEWLSLNDARNKSNYPNRHFDLVVALDFFEHIYEEDLACVEEEMFRVAKKWVFILIATTRGGNNGQTEKYIKANPMRILSLEKQLLDQGMRFRPDIRGTEYTLKKDVPHYEGRNEPAEGHVTFQPEEYWLNRFAKYGTYRPDLVDYFCTLADNRVIENWILNSIIVMEV